MIDVFRWLIVVEIIGLAALPVTVLAFGSLPDIGSPFAKILGLILVVWIIWWMGEFVAVGGNAVWLWIVLAVGGIVGWLCMGRQTVAMLRPHVCVIVVEEAIFVAAFLLWCLVRSFHPDIGGSLALLTTEKPMDLMLLQTTSHSSTYPPQDLWLAGSTVNYYYFGYLIMAAVGNMAGTSVLVTYNLALALIFALAAAATYSIIYNLTRKLGWSLLGPLFVVLLGNAHALFFQVAEGKFPWNQGFWYFESSRVVGATAAGAATINEFPLFSLVLGDLHPHLIAIPIVLLAITFALALLVEVRSDRACVRPSTLMLAAITVGSLFATNSWDFPTYLLLCLGAIGVGAWLKWTARPRSVRPITTASTERFAILPQDWLGIAARSGTLLCLSVVAFLPFFLQYKSPANGLGVAHSPTDVTQFTQVFGIPGLVAVGFLAAYIRYRNPFSLRRFFGWFLPASAGNGSIRSSLSTYSVPVACITLIAVIAVLHLWVLLIAVIVAAAAIAALIQRSGAGSEDHLTLSNGLPRADSRAKAEQFTNDQFGLLLVLLAALIVGGTELFYLRDSFDGTIFYRMNTVFKFYYQVWILLGLAAAYGAIRVAQFTRTHGPSAFVTWVAIVAIACGIGGVYTVLGPLSYYGDLTGGTVSLQPHPLNGLEGLAQTDQGDYRAITWLQEHILGQPRILEATGGEYSLFARVSTYTSLPTLLGWEGHEEQWRGNDPVLQQRHAVIDRIYATGSARLAQRLLRQAHVALVYVGPCERQVYGRGPSTCGQSPTVASAPDALMKFGSFMDRVYNRDGVQIFHMHG